MVTKAHKPRGYMRHKTFKAIMHCIVQYRSNIFECMVLIDKLLGWIAGKAQLYGPNLGLPLIWHHAQFYTHGTFIL